MMAIIGIDPGLTGAIAVLRGQELQEVFDIPVVPVRWGVKSRMEISPASLFAALAGIHDVQAVVLEEVSASPQMGATSAFRFGQGYGCVQGVVAACGYRLEMVRPAMWKKAMSLSRDKGVSRSLAMRLWPDQSELFARVKDDGRAEAALMAEWYRQH